MLPKKAKKVNCGEGCVCRLSVLKRILKVGAFSALRALVLAYLILEKLLLHEMQLYCVLRIC